MSLVEVSKSVGELAKAVHEKSKTLDSLIDMYNKKLQLINRYTEKLPGMADFEESIEEDEFLKYLEGVKEEEYLLIPRRLIREVGKGGGDKRDKGNKGNKGNKGDKGDNGDEGDKGDKVDKGAIKVIDEKSTENTGKDTEKNTQQKNSHKDHVRQGYKSEGSSKSQTSNPSESTTSSSSSSSSKRTCSYCLKTGHSRARCFQRSNGKPPTRNHT